MNTFAKLNKNIQERFKILCNTGKLFRVEISGEELWNIYINSFDDHPIWRVNSVHNCNNDRHFFERYANIVAIADGKIITMFDDLAGNVDIEYSKSVEAVSQKIRNSKISSVFVETYGDLQLLGSITERNKLNKNQQEFRLGNEKTLKEYKTQEEAMNRIVGKVYEFYHFNVIIPRYFIDFSGKSSGAILGDLNTTRQLFEKTLDIPLDTLELVRDLLQQGSLLKGDMYLDKVLEVIKLKKQFDNIPSDKRDNWLWLNFQNTPFARFANELIGVTCIELAEGKELNKVCKDFNIRVDPANYNKAKSPITKSMIEQAEKTIMELGYDNSFERRFAMIDDIDVSEIKHSNIDASKEKAVGLFASAGIDATKISTRHKRSEFDKVEEIHIDKFMSDILPNASSVEVFMENRFENNLVSLFAPKDKKSKNLFKWNNTFSWTYNGNLSGKSMIKEAVKTSGGNIDGVLRASMIWNESGSDNSDLDIWCKQPNNISIGYSAGYRKDSGNKFSNCGGQLDLDNTSPNGKLAVENIYFRKLEEMIDGTYEIHVHQYYPRNSQGFKFEIEFQGEIFCYEYNKSVSGRIPVANVTLKNGKFSIEHKLPHTTSNKNIWNLETNEFHKVNLICSSPNHWGDNNIGSKEYFFMIQNCKTSDSMRTFHVDQLNTELLGVRKAIDMLGNYKLAEPSDKQLSGIGFNCTVRDHLIVKVKGSHQRVLKINF